MSSLIRHAYFLISIKAEIITRPIDETRRGKCKIYLDLQLPLLLSLSACKAFSDVKRGE